MMLSLSSAHRIYHCTNHLLFHLFVSRCWTRGKGLRSRYVDTFSHDPSDFTPPASGLKMLGSSPLTSQTASVDISCFSFFHSEDQHQIQTAPNPNQDHASPSLWKSPVKFNGSSDSFHHGATRLPLSIHTQPLLSSLDHPLLCSTTPRKMQTSAPPRTT